jgi:hypothetical protein
MIAIIDYKAGNFTSVVKAVRFPTPTILRKTMIYTLV